jgi:Rad3-related DNA helicase
LGDFSDFAVEVKGRGNFPCLQEDGVTAADAQCTIAGGCNPECPYSIQRDIADESGMVIHSYAMFLNSANYAGRFKDNSLLVLDEAHLLDDMLMAFTSCSVVKRVCALFSIPVHAQPTWEKWRQWAKVYADGLEHLLEDTVKETMFSIEARRKYKAGQALLTTMNRLRFGDVPWVCDPTPHGWEFKPVWIGGLADQYLYRHARKVLLMSATILNPRIFSQIVGIDPAETEFIDVPPSFPVGRKPVFYDPVGVVNRDSDKRPIAEKVWEIIQEHKGEKGLIHAVSYELAQAIRNGAPPSVSKRLLTHGPTDRLAVYELFRLRTDDPVLLSPSMKEGVSLEDDQCRFIIIPKMPYPYLGSPQIKARMDTPLGRSWYPWKTFCDLIQMSGRGMRSAEDFCAVYILDANFRRLWREMYEVIPDYWRAEVHDVRHFL